MKLLKQTWGKLSSDWQFAHELVDTDSDRLHMVDERGNGVPAYSSLLAILVAGLGLFGLSHFTAEQRTKEIGIRKVTCGVGDEYRPAGLEGVHPTAS